MRKKVIVLMGGKTPEYEISLISGKEVVSNLSREKYDVIPVVISRDGSKWKLTSSEDLLETENPLNLKGSKKELVLKKAKISQSINEIVKGEKDLIVFIAMHGPFGEDGAVQGMLELAGIRYTGSGVLASALGMDKIMFRKIMEFEGIPIPKYTLVKKDEGFSNIFARLGSPPYFVKPPNQGSSVGCSLVRAKKDLKKALNLAFRYASQALVDEYVSGKEVTCALLGNENPKALPLVEIRPKMDKFFDYNSKYLEGGADEIVPAKISEELTRKIQEISIRVHKVLGCKGFSRVDFIVKDDKEPVVLEINTIPGLTPMSLFPKAAKAVEISYQKLLEEIIYYAEK